MRILFKYLISGALALLVFMPFPSGQGTPLSDRMKKTGVASPRLPYAVAVLPGIVESDRAVKAGLLFDVNENKIVWEKGLYASFPIASLTKLMTVLLILEDIQDGKINWETTIPVTQEAANIGSSKIWMKPGQVFTVEDLMKSAMISSANDACYLLAQSSGGTEKAFVQRMNNKAYQLGMNNTYYVNTTGLPASKREMDNFSSPSDLLLLAKEVLKSEEIVKIACINKDQICTVNQKFDLKNHNKLVADYPEIGGLKTGYTRKAGFCIVATAQKEDKKVIGIVLGAMSPVQRNDFVAKMFDNYYHDILCVGKLIKPVVPKQSTKKHKSKLS